MEPDVRTIAVPQRKRSGRPSKTASTVEKQRYITSAGSTFPNPESMTSAPFQNVDFSSSGEQFVEIEGPTLDMSPTPDDQRVAGVAGSGTNAGGSTGSAECRRSSRKKIIKFDVRDLLNKNRKPHKIQIEARIDSNAPPSPKSSTATSSAGVGGSCVGDAASTIDLSNKQKTFFEKSAIFRRLSTSEQQNKKMAPPLLPPFASVPKVSILGKPNDELTKNVEAFQVIDPVKVAQAHRLSRTQEIFNASLMKSKQNSSLIVAQIESSSAGNSSGSLSNIDLSLTHKKGTSGRRKNLVKMSSLKSVAIKDMTSEPIMQKRRGRPPKNKALAEQTTVLSSTRTSGLEESAEKSTKHSSAPKKEGECETRGKIQLSEDFMTTNLESINTAYDKGEERKVFPDRANNWKEYKAYLKEASDILENEHISTSSTSVKVKLENESTLSSDHASEDIILEISSSSSISTSTSGQDTSHDKTSTSTEVSESQQRNFASVCFWQETPNASDNPSAPEFIVAAVEEIITESDQQSDNAVINSSSLLNSDNADDHSTDVNTTDIKELNSNVEDTETFDHNRTEKQDNQNSLLSDAIEIQSPTSRKSSSSESDTNSDRSNKPYKKGDKLRVSLKRLSFPQSSSNSAITILSLTSNTSDSSTKCTNSNGDNLDNDNNKESNIDGPENNPTKINSKNTLSSNINNEADDFFASEKSLLETFNTDLEQKSLGKYENKTPQQEIESSKTIKTTENNDTFENDLITFKKSTLITMEDEIKCIENKVNDEESILVDSTTANTLVEPKLELESGIKEDATTEKKSVDICESKSSNLAECKVQPMEIDFHKQFNMQEDIMKTNKEELDQISPMPQFENKTKIDVDALTLQPAVIKERITLPLKKQVSKLKMYETIIDANKEPPQTLPITNETVNVEKQEETLWNGSKKMFESVSVETSTLLDILKTVQQNKVSTSLAKTEVTNEITCSEPKCESEAGLLPKDVAINKTDEPKNTNSPTQAPKKAARRFEKRSQRGEEVCYKTLEETFAEIAAESSKAVLMSKAARTNISQKNNENTFDEDKTKASNPNTCPENDKNIVDETRSEIVVESLIPGLSAKSTDIDIAQKSDEHFIGECELKVACGISTAISSSKFTDVNLPSENDEHIVGELKPDITAGALIAKSCLNVTDIDTLPEKDKIIAKQVDTEVIARSLKTVPKSKPTDIIIPPEKEGIITGLPKKEVTMGISKKVSKPKQKNINTASEKKEIITDQPQKNINIKIKHKIGTGETTNEAIAGRPKTVSKLKPTNIDIPLEKEEIVTSKTKTEIIVECLRTVSKPKLSDTNIATEKNETTTGQLKMDVDTPPEKGKIMAGQAKIESIEKHPKTVLITKSSVINISQSYDESVTGQSKTEVIAGSSKTVAESKSTDKNISQTYHESATGQSKTEGIAGSSKTVSKSKLADINIEPERHEIVTDQPKTEVYDESIAGKSETDITIDDSKSILNLKDTDIVMQLSNDKSVSQEAKIDKDPNVSCKIEEMKLPRIISDTIKDVNLQTTIAETSIITHFLKNKSKSPIIITNKLEEIDINKSNENMACKSLSNEASELQTERIANRQMGGNLEVAANTMSSDVTQLERKSKEDSLVMDSHADKIKVDNVKSITPSRRGRKPKNKSSDFQETLKGDKALNIVGDAVDNLLAPVKEMRKQKTSKGSSTNDTSGLVEEPKSIIDSHWKKELSMSQKEESMLKAPPKKRLLKFQMKEKTEKASCSDESSDNRNIDPPDIKHLLKKPKSDSNKETFSKKNKKSGSLHTKNVDKSNFEAHAGPSSDEVSRSATSTPISKRGKQQKKTEKISEEKSGQSGKKKYKKSEGSLVLNNTLGSKISTKKERKRVEPSSALKKIEKKKFLESESVTGIEISKKLEEKIAKKKRQKKLKEAFEAALNDDAVKRERTITQGEENKSLDRKCNTVTQALQASEPIATITYDKPIVTSNETSILESKNGSEEKPPITVNVIEEEPDPLKDIEKFIEDGVNLLKRGYKIDDDSVDDVITSKSILDERKMKCETQEANDNMSALVAQNSLVMNNTDSSFETSTVISSPLPQPDPSEDNKLLNTNTFFETPADTPIATPTVTPPPKSPISSDLISDESAGVRRSHRIKQITKTPKALVGRGLVRDKERFSLKDDVETKSTYSLDDHLTDLAEVEAKNAKFLKDMEERLSNFHVIKENEYKCERVISKEARKMICDCFLTAEEEGRGELGCGEDCLNRLLMIECGPDCNVKERCTNKRFQKFLCSPCRVFRTEKKGFGILADIEILPGEFIMEYVGEVIDGDEFERRRTMYSLDKNRHYYFMALRSDAIIDATIKGNISRFINHSCDPNAETQKWTVNGELRIGFFSRKSIMPGEEITFDYQYQRYGREAQRCYCESANCRGWIGQEPNSDEGEQVDEDSDGDNLVEGLLESDDDESDESIADTDETHKNLESVAVATKLSLGESGKAKTDERTDTSKDRKKKVGDDDRKESDEDSKSKFKRLLNKIGEKGVKIKKKNQKEKKQRRRRPLSTKETATKKSRYLEDPDIEDEVNFLSRCGLKNQSDTLRFSRLMVRAKLAQTRLNLLQILRKGELPCRRLFLDYHGLRLLHGWMSEDGGDMAIRLALLETLESLPIANKTVLTDSKVYQSVRNWCGASTVGGAASGGSTLSPSDESSKESSSSNSQGTTNNQEVPSELQKLALKLTSTWDSLPEIFRIPKRERIEQMKEHEREADRQFAATATEDSNRSILSDRYQRDRFGRDQTTSRYMKPYNNKDMRNNITVVGGSTSVSDPRRRSAMDAASNMNESTKHLSKEQRREMFAAKVARDEAEKRLAEERREFETKCRFFGLDPKKIRPQDVPFCVDPVSGQWYSVERKPIATPPSYAHVHPHLKSRSTDPADYKLPPVVDTLPAQWKFAITPQGKIYYYHVQLRVPQWDPPTEEQIRACREENSSSESECEINDSSNEDDEELIMGMDKEQIKIYIDKKVEARRNKRYNRLVEERPISPRKEEDRIYNQLEVRKYKENKEKIRKRKEEIRRKRAESLKSITGGMVTTGNTEEANSSNEKTYGQELADALPIQDYLLSSDEEDIIKAECNNSPLLEKIVQGDKIVDELDALTTKRPLKRPLPPHRELNVEPGCSSTSSSSDKYEHKKRKTDKKEKSKKIKESDSKYRRLKEKFRCEIAGIIVQHLKPYRKDSCNTGRIQSNDDFNHLARKLTHFVMIKELKYCESVGQTLVVTESVKNKSREFIKKYMTKYGDIYVKPGNDPEFKEIPFTI